MSDQTYVHQNKARQNNNLVYAHADIRVLAAQCRTVHYADTVQSAVAPHDQCINIMRNCTALHCTELQL
jgi:hypothetical protein